MQTEIPRPVLKNKKALVVGIANEHSIAYGCAKAFREVGAELDIKAALEAVCRYLAYELGSRKIRVHAISPGPLKTRAASGLKDFDRMLNDAVERSPVGELMDIMDVGFTCAFLATPFGRRLTGQTNK
jgi:enoyl-[acyl-carrier protein] reductase I